MSIRVVTDSTCDLSQAEIEQHGITVIPLYVNIDGQSYRDGVDLRRDEFYARLPGCDGRMTTSAPGPGVFADTYRRLADEGATGIISLHLSSELSNVCQVAQMAAQETPSVPVHVLDSGNISLATGLAAMVAAEEAARGAPLPELIRKVNRCARRSYCYAVLNTVEHLRRSGRVS
ncbi:MAG: DegV family protein [Chloroflexi bacterium]|nr:DegV family protein [Chloroflexota bacterium]